MTSNCDPATTRPEGKKKKEGGGGELTQLDVSIERKQDVVRLDISVDNALRVQMFQTQQSLHGYQNEVKSHVSKM